MSDRVAIIGGETVGRDHFPYPNYAIELDSSVDVGDGTPYPAVGTLEDITSWFYLVRRWRLTVTLVYYSYFNGTVWVEYTGTVSVDLEETVDYPSNDALVRESDLVKDRGAFGGVQYTDFIADSSGTFLSGTLNDYNYSSTMDDPDPSSEVLGLRVEVFHNFGRPHWQEGGDTWPVLFILRLSTGGFEWTTENTIGTDTPTEMSLGPYTFNIRGNNFEASPATGNVISIAECSFVPILYWPYATKGDDPVYNTSTGAIINDPFS